MTTKYVGSFLAHTTLRQSTVAKKLFFNISTTIHSSHHHTTDNDCCIVVVRFLASVTCQSSHTVSHTELYKIVHFCYLQTILDLP